MFGRALEVGGTHHGAIVHTRGLCQFHAHPLALGKLNITDVTYSTLLTFPCNHLAQRNRTICRLLFRGECSRLIVGWRGCHNNWRDCRRRCRCARGWCTTIGEQRWLSKHAVLGCACKVWNTHNSAIMHACGFCQLHAHPLARGKLHFADIAYNPLLAAPCDLLPQGNGAISRPLL